MRAIMISVERHMKRVEKLAKVILFNPTDVGASWAGNGVGSDG
jgi:hypothetical protein